VQWRVGFPGLLGLGLALMMAGCHHLVMVDAASDIGRFYGVWYMASSTIVFGTEEERKHWDAYFQLPCRGCPI